MLAFILIIHIAIEKGITTKFIGGTLEALFNEIELSSVNNVLIGVIYRSPHAHIYR